MAAGFLAGALFGVLIGELGVWALVGVTHLFVAATLLLATLGIVAGASARALTVMAVVDALLLCLVFLVAFTPIMRPLMRPLVRADSLPTRGVDAVVALSADVTSSGTISDIAADRLLTALDFAKRSAAPRLFTTRVAHSRYGAALSTDADQARLVALAGLSDRWTPLPDQVQNTHDEALATARRLRPSGSTTIALVTSPWHTRRACATFEAVGMRVVCVPALERGDQTVIPVTQSDRLAAFRYFLYERVAWLEYRRRGWLPKQIR